MNLSELLVSIALSTNLNGLTDVNFGGKALLNLTYTVGCYCFVCCERDGQLSKEGPYTNMLGSLEGKRS